MTADKHRSIEVPPALPGRLGPGDLVGWWAMPVLNPVLSMFNDTLVPPPEVRVASLNALRLLGTVLQAEGPVQMESDLSDDIRLWTSSRLRQDMHMRRSVPLRQWTSILDRLLGGEGALEPDLIEYMLDGIQDEVFEPVRAFEDRLSGTEVADQIPDVEGISEASLRAGLTATFRAHRIAYRLTDLHFELCDHDLTALAKEAELLAGQPLPKLSKATYV